MSARVLVVDDIHANRRLMQAKLEARYHTVILAENGLDALHKAKHQNPHIILLDIMMPGLDGYQVCRRLKKADQTQHIPVVMLTALNSKEDRLRGLEAGADDFLSKPVDDFALMARLSALTRYYAVAKELKRREASGRHETGLTEDERAELETTGNILVIDSNMRSTQNTTGLLNAAGHHAVAWQGIQNGATMNGHLDMVILALSNQQYNPLKLCAHLHAMENTRELAIIVTCTPDDQDDAAQALNIGAGDVIVDPVDDQELLARVRTQLRRSRYVEILRRRVDRGLELSVIDPLTGLYNRRYMLGQLEQWLKRAERGGLPVSVVAFDIDHFKRINDRYGHDAGDQVLKSFSECIRKNVRPKDIVCRPGGEEFLVIMPETTNVKACASADRIRCAIADNRLELGQGDTTIQVTVSGGVSTYASAGDTTADILQRADNGLYRAKEGGRNRIGHVAAV